MAHPLPQNSQDGLVFRGIDGRECEEFIRSVRREAFARDKLDDSRWIAQFASVAFSGPALRWLTSLNPVVAQDWDMLQLALLRVYPPVSNTVPQAAGVAPAAAAPAPGIQNPLSNASQIQVLASLRTTLWTGRIKVVPNDSRRASTYIASALDPTINVAKTCKLARDALIVQFTPYRFPYVFSIPSAGASTFPYLGAASRTDRSVGAVHGYVSPTFSGLQRSTGQVISMYSHSKAGGPQGYEMWSVSLDGTILGLWEAPNGNLHGLIPAINADSDRLSMVQNWDGFMTMAQQSYIRARLLFEPLQ